MTRRNLARPRHRLGPRSCLADAAVPPAAGARLPPAPVARVEPVEEWHFGERLVDPYRWMENDRDPDWLPFLRGQAEHTLAQLGALPVRSALLARIRELSGRLTLTRTARRVGERLFYEQRAAGAESFALYVREGASTRVLIDPGTPAGEGVHQALDWWEPSPDGAHVVYGLSRGGSENSVLRVRAVDSDTDLPEVIPDTGSAEPHWLADGSGFFYNQLTGALDTPERFLDSRARWHRLGTDPAHDPIIMQRGMDPGVAFERIQMPHVITSASSPYALLRLTDIRREQQLYVAPVAAVLAGTACWQPLVRFEDEITAAALDGERLYLLSEHGHPRGRLLCTRVEAASLRTATEVLAEGPMVIEQFRCARDGLYVLFMDGGVHRLSRLAPDGALQPIALPVDGTVRALRADAAQDGILFAFTSWLLPEEIWHAGPEGPAPTGLTPATGIDVSAYECLRAQAPARDGTAIPYTLIRRRDAKRDGSAPAFISAYGAYGLSAYTPVFAARTLALVDAGFTVGYAAVRGGGEFGRAWHQAGRLDRKSNTWRDLIDVCEALCARGETSPARLAIGGRSAGGVAVGRAMTERPSLFAAVVSGVGWSNPLRYVAEQNSFSEEPEWGAIDDPAGFRALRAIDSYQSVVDGTAYPAVLLTTGVTDPRVAPFHAAKMAARLQAASRSGRPVLLRVDFDAGHGMGSTRDQQDREAADTYAFLLWQCSLRDPRRA